jgi:Helix-turn-helix domain
MSEDNLKQVSVTPEQAAKLYGLNPGSLANLRSRKTGPTYYKRGKKVLYKVEDLERWLFEEPVMTIDQHQFEH